MSFLGLNFGASTQKSSQTEDMTKNESTTQNQNTQSNQNTTGTQNTTQTGTTTSTGTSATTNAGSSASTQATQQQQAATTSSFSADVLSKLTDLFSSAADGSGASTASGTLDTLLKQLGSFNANDYVSGVTNAAKQTIDASTAKTIGASDSAIGGTAGTNSMAALLDTNTKNAGATSLAGIQAQAEATAQQIVGSNATTVESAVGQQNNLLVQLADALKGGTTSTTAATTGTTAATGTTSSTSGTTTSEAGTSSQNTATLSTQDVATLIDQLLTGVTNTSGTSTTNGSTTKIGGGFSLGI